MSQEVKPVFRSGSVLATVFTGTLGERHGDRLERTPTPTRFLEWLELNGLSVKSCTNKELELAHCLREAIHRAATATATGGTISTSDIEMINQGARQGQAYPQLTPDAVQVWQLGDSSPGSVKDALAVIAADAISILTVNPERLALCASPTCRAVFVDTSQSRTRRWCDMNTCGNKQKKARHRRGAMRPRD